MSKKHKRQCGSGFSEYIGLNRPWWLFWTINFKPDCAIHDDDYTEGGTEEDRLQADIRLHDNMQSRCEKKWLYKIPTYRMRCDATCDSYHLAVRKFGDSSFSYQGDKDSLSLKHYLIGIENETEKRNLEGKCEFWLVERYYKSGFTVMETVDLYMRSIGK